MLKNKKSNLMFKILATLIVAGWMVAVFILSGQNGYKSLNLSGKVINKLAQIVRFIDNPMQDNEIVDVEYYHRLQLIVRKSAHYVLYAIGGIVLSSFFYFFIERDFVGRSHVRKMRKGYIILSILMGVIYSISDELHQKYIFGRSSSVLDVLIDSAGVITGVLLATLVVNLANKRRNKFKMR